MRPVASPVVAGQSLCNGVTERRDRRCIGLGGGRNVPPHSPPLSSLSGIGAAASSSQAIVHFAAILRTVVMFRIVVDIPSVFSRRGPEKSDSENRVRQSQ